MLARENPHCGVSGVPFMNRTTGAEDTASSIAVRVSADKKRLAMGEIRGENLEAKDGAAARRKAWMGWDLALEGMVGTQEDTDRREDGAGKHVV